MRRTSGRRTTGRRISVVGPTGSGKTATAARLAEHFSITPVDLDALFWEDGWTGADDDRFTARVATAVEGAGWVIAGNYSRVQPLIWERADTVVWLDLPFPLVAARLLQRTARRIRTGERLWGTDNRETVRRTVSRDSVLWWLVKTFRRTRRRYLSRLREPRWGHLRAVRLRRSGDVEAFLRDPDGGLVAFAYPRAS